MIVTNKLDKTFGPQMAVSGYFLMVFGLIFILDIMGALMFLVGFILATTIDGVSFDTQKRMLKRFSGPMGIRIIGKWEKLERYAGFTLIPVRTKNVTLSRSNRQHITTQNDYRIYVVGHDHKPAFAVYKNDSKEQALKEMDKLTGQLQWSVWTIDESYK